MALREVLEVRNRMFEGLNVGEHKLRLLPGLRAKGGADKGALRQIGLVSEAGLVNLPVMIAVQRGLEHQTNGLRVEDKGTPGDMGEMMMFGITGVGDFFIYPSRLGTEVDWYITGKPGERGAVLIMDGKITGGLGLRLEQTSSAVFGLKLQEGIEKIFEQTTGWELPEDSLDAVIRQFSRQVDLSLGSLSEAGKAKYYQFLNSLSNPRLFQRRLKENFGLTQEGQYQTGKLDGDIEVEMVQLEDASRPGTTGTIINIWDIVLPKPNSEFSWTHLVRPKADSRKGTLKIIIYSDGSFKGVVTDGVVRQEGYNTEQLVTASNLAAILAKIEVNK